MKKWLLSKSATMMLGLINKQSQNAGFIVGISERNGNMPYRTVYSISDKGKKELRDTLIKSILSFDFDTNIFSIAVFFIDFFEPDEQISLLKKRAEILKKYITGIENWILYREDISIPFSHIVIVERMADPAKTELAGTNKLLEMLQTN